ncbi:MAG: hypothetical protein AB7O26_20080, partial [Planctomycetaceae bacterium]
MSQRRLFLLIPLAFVVLAQTGMDVRAAQPTWKAGFAKEKITPGEPMWMSGYGPRLAKEKIHDIWIKVLALEAADGKQAVLITADVCGFSRLSYDAIVSGIERACGLKRDRVMLTCTHTHTGPALRECLHVCWPWAERDARELVEQYSLGLESQVVAAAKRAISELQPAVLSTGAGTTDFAVNRRNNKEPDVPAIREKGESLRGPVDHSIPVLAVRTPEGKLRTVVFGYACHATTLALTQWSGDYPGFAMLALERLQPGAEAMFYQGCGADQNPIPRRTVEICREYGERLAAAVNDTLASPMRPIAPELRSAFAFAELNFKSPLTSEYLKEKSAEKSPQGALAERYLQQLAEGRPLDTSHPYAIQVWKLGKDQLWISLAGEVVVDYSLKYKEKFGPRTWVNGFAHDLVCYVPSTRVLREGGGQEVGVPTCGKGEGRRSACRGTTDFPHANGPTTSSRASTRRS